MSILAIDTETTGSDFHHGCRPFLVSTCSDNGDVVCWQFDVDPKTRRPMISPPEVKEIQEYILGFDRLLYHNAKFDTHALSTIGVLDGIEKTPNYWSRVEDTHLMSHVLWSADSHKLKDLAVRVLDETDEDQQELRRAVLSARGYGSRNGWNLARKGHPELPSLTKAPQDGFWVLDMWTPRAVAKQENYQTTHPWWDVVKTYAARDAERTMALYLVLREGIKEHNLEGVYRTRLATLQPIYDMECQGLSMVRANLDNMRSEHQANSESYRKLLASEGVDNPDSNQQLQDVLYGRFGLAPLKENKTGFSVDKASIAHCQSQVRPRTRASRFLANLDKFNAYAKSADTLAKYRRCALPVRVPGRLGNASMGLRIHPSYNPCGTKETRLSSYDPNAQNVSKLERTNHRKCFGPLPGRVWYAIDYSNIEMRIFAYLANDEGMIQAFQDGKSAHMEVAKVLYPDLVSQCQRDGISFQDKYKSTLYQWIKNGNFALIYGAAETHADNTYHYPGATKLIRDGMPKIDSFMKESYQQSLTGYVQCLGGYRLQVPGTEYHKASNYRIQGAAGWAMVLAMIRCHFELRRTRYSNDHHMICCVHDELLFDFPIDHDPNLPTRMMTLMERSGDDLGLPLPVEGKRIEHDWSHGIGI